VGSSMFTTTRWSKIVKYLLLSAIFLMVNSGVWAQPTPQEIEPLLKEIWKEIPFPSTEEPEEPIRKFASLECEEFHEAVLDKIEHQKKALARAVQGKNPIPPTIAPETWVMFIKCLPTEVHYPTDDAGKIQVLIEEIGDKNHKKLIERFHTNSFPQDSQKKFLTWCTQTQWMGIFYPPICKALSKDI
jgi:hypothetical protein